MKEIKFRAINSEGKLIYDIDIPKAFLIHNLPIMQFTGLKDKNGREIYEGDIMKSLGREICVVRWIDQLACFMIENINPTDDFDNILMPLHKGYEQREIIGNIYENPELL